MSNNKELTQIEREGLLAAGLPVDTPSQLSDAFRLGMTQLQKENDELRANHLKTYEMNIKLCGLVASMHLRIDDEKASEIVCDESVKIIGEFRADQLTPAQSLADIRAEAVIEAADKVIRHNEHSFCIHCSLIDHANRIKEG